MRKYVYFGIYAFLLLFLIMYIGVFLIFEEATLVFVTVYGGFALCNYDNLFCKNSFCLYRYGSRKAAAVKMQKSMLLPILIFTSVSLFICLLGYTPEETETVLPMAIRFFVCSIINFNISSMLIYLISVIYGKMKAVGVYFTAMLAGSVLNYLIPERGMYIYEFIYLTYSFGSFAEPLQRAANMAVGYCLAAIALLWLWKKYKTADMRI